MMYIRYRSILVSLCVEWQTERIDEHLQQMKALPLMHEENRGLDCVIKDVQALVKVRDDQFIIELETLVLNWTDDALSHLGYAADVPANAREELEQYAALCILNNCHQQVEKRLRDLL